MKILFENNQNKIEATEAQKGLIEKVIEKSIEIEGFQKDAEISVVLTDDEQIKKINNAYRNIDRATDVISFPMLDIAFGKINETAGDEDIDANLIMMGDIVISLERAEAQAKEYGHSFERELGFLTAHGMFHLLGYDHTDKAQEEIMIQKQETVLKSVGLGKDQA